MSVIRSVKRQCILLCYALHLASGEHAAIRPGHGAEPEQVKNGPDAVAVWKYPFNGWRAERERLVSYEVHITGGQTSFKGTRPVKPYDLTEPSG